MTVPADQYHAARERAGLFDRTARGRLLVSGGDRAAFLHGILTNDIAALAPGQGCYAMYLTVQGRVIADMDVLNTGDAFLLGVHADVTAALCARLDQLVFTEDVRIADGTDALAEWHVCGPEAAVLVASLAEVSEGRLAPARLAALPEYGSLPVRIGAGDVRVARLSPTGLDGFSLFVDAAHGTFVHRTLVAAGAVELSPEVVETLRVEAGVPAFHRDIDETTIPLETGVEARAISFTKGCYVGQEVIVRVMHRGHGRVARKLVGLAVDGEVVPVPGDPIRVGDRDAGRVTSAVRSPALGRPIALGYVHRDCLEPGTAVEIVRADARLPAVVTALPFVRQEPGRPAPSAAR
ncbi:MAG TPA: glycine cleavage T C-terminal barrel domain-containing protein [Vicinamibacterales bacterium]|nr:glycine cleavage T C-terminal barrel domain-containing protein [Vicinamibacterales bacterium]